ncbi:MAG: LuxR C-terminal-related transcriptional regulator [Oscillibacter sp.]|jgi:LuxR family maltose regulon positive regulatory protein|nr:LuxR C-terminal-related transcriptional regulator [Oscillibacter sp.]
MEYANNIMIRPKLRELFQDAWHRCRVIFCSGPCGFGKTTAAMALLEGHTVQSISASAEDCLPTSLNPACDVLLLDDFQLLRDCDDQETLCDWIRTNPQKHFVLLSRGVLPGWLMAFQLSGLLLTIDSGAFLWDRTDMEQYLSACGVAVSPAELTAIHSATSGYALAAALLCRRLKRGERFSDAMENAVEREVFLHFETAVYRRFEPSMRCLLISLAPFEHFDLELAQLVSGDIQVGELLSSLLRDTTMLLPDGRNTYRFWPGFRRFLLWELAQEYTLPEQQAVYSRAGLYYELHGDYARGLECYDKSGEHRKVSELLVKNAECHPGVGHYYDMERYYYAMPEEEILRSPSLMCGMSMLTAMNMDFETSERWYAALKEYATRLKKSDAEYRDVRGKLAYLDIALPQRGSHGLLEVIADVFRVLTDKEIKIPAFSVTSTLPSVMNGGKDFCEWSKRDDLLYATMRRPVEAVLGRDGVGLADCAICESKFEKGEDVSQRLLSLLSRQAEIRRKGTPDIEFAVTGLLVRAQMAQGKAASALETLENLREDFEESGQTRFLANLDAMRCRIWLRLGMTDEADGWLREKAPASTPRMRAMWRYQYQTAAMVRIRREEYDEALQLLAPLMPYCTVCGRVMDELHLRLLTAICDQRTDNPRWKSTLSSALDLAGAYRFIRPVAQYGGAILPLLTDCGWDGDTAYFDRLLTETRAQAVNYPDFLRPVKMLAEPLSPAEKQVLRLLCFDRSNQEIADTLGIKLPTVKTHVNHILQKMGVKRRSEAKTAAETLHLV